MSDETHTQPQVVRDPPAPIYPEGTEYEMDVPDPDVPEQQTN